MEKLEILESMYTELLSRGKVTNRKTLAKITGASETAISLAFKGDPKYCTDSLLRRINQASGGIFNPAWLITGVGPMLAVDTAQVENIVGGNANIGTGNTYVAGIDAAEFASLRKENEELKEETTILRREVAERDKTIARLEGKIELYKEMLAK